MADFPFFESRNRLASAPVSWPIKGPGVPGTQPRWSIHVIEGAQTTEELTDKLISASVTYDAQGGCSMAAVLDQRVAGFDGRDVVVRAGYGDETDRIFFGRVFEYREGEYTDLGQITAGGTGVIRGKQRANMGLDFSNLTLRQSMEYINRKAGEFGEWGMIGGDEYHIHDPEADRDTEAETNQPGYGVFGSETTWSEIERALLEPTKYVQYDNPHGHVIHKKPSIRFSGDPENYTWWWTPHTTPGDYPRGGFQFIAGTREIFNRVILFRKTQDYGEYVTESQGAGEPKRVREFYSVYAEVAVNRTGRYQMPEGTDYVEPDFNGTQNQAENQAAEMARDYETVKGTFEYTGPFRTWWPNDVVYVERIEHRPGPRLSHITGVPLPSGDSKYVRSLYTCLINGSITQNIGRAQFNASISGEAALRSMSAIPDPAEASYRSTGLVPVGVG